MGRFFSTGRVLAALLSIIFLSCSSMRTYRVYKEGEIPVSEEATLIFPMGVHIDKLDGEDIVIDKFLRSGRIDLKMKPGPHTVIVRYSVDWEKGSFESELVESDPVSLDFKADPGEYYIVEFTRPWNYADASTFAASPEFKIAAASTKERREAKGQQVHSMLKPAPVKDKPAREKDETVRTVDDYVNTYTSASVQVRKPKETASVEEPVTEPVTPAPAVEESEDEVITAPAVVRAESSPPALARLEGVQALPLLKHWWKAASSDEKTEFRTWIEE